MARGHLFARFGVRNGATRLLQQRQNAPLKIARAFPSSARPGALDVCVMDASPGLLAGDHVSYEWELEAGAQVRITAQGATRVHPAPPDEQGTTSPDEQGTVSPFASCQTIFARVGEGARLELWPESIIPFRGASFESQTEIWLGARAQLSLFECLSAGRIARGEEFEFERVSLQTLVLDERGPLFCARNRFIPAQFRPQNRFGFGEMTHWATLIACGDHLDAASTRTAQDVIEKRDLRGGASLLSRGGAAVSLLVRRSQEARLTVLEIEALWNNTFVSRETA